MREKVLLRSVVSVTELALLEMLLYPSDPGGNTKLVAKKLMQQLQTLAGALHASAEKLKETEQVGQVAIGRSKPPEQRRFI